MCPFCLAGMGMIAVGATSAGGLTALAVKLSRKKASEEMTTKPNERSNQDVDSNN